MKKILLTFLFTIASYFFIFYFTGSNGAILNRRFAEYFTQWNTITFFLIGGGFQLAYILIAMRYSNNKTISKNERLFFNLYSPWAIFGYSIAMFNTTAATREEFRFAFENYSVLFGVMIFTIIITNIYSIYCYNNPKSKLLNFNSVLIVLSDMFLIGLYYLTMFLFIFQK